MALNKYYFDKYIEYGSKYGSNLVILIQVGKFYEVYEYRPELDGTIITVSELCMYKLQASAESPSSYIGASSYMSKILNMRLTCKRKGNPHSKNNPLMMGFQPLYYEQHRDVILSHGYTIVKIDQKDRSSTEEDVEREVTEILSPGTTIDYVVDSNKIIVCIYIEIVTTQKWKTDPFKIICGISIVNIITGQSIVYEIYSKENDEVYAINELYRVLLTQNPIELLIHIKCPEHIQDNYEEYLYTHLDLHRYPIRVVLFNSIPSNFYLDNYQEQIYDKVFGSSEIVIQPGTSNWIYELNLELFKYGGISYVILLQYCNEHNEHLLDRINKPNVNWTDGTDYLILTHNAIEQLDLISTSRYSSILSVVDYTITHMGKRLLKQRLTNPLTSVEKLERIYTLTEELLSNTGALDDITRELKYLPDLDRLNRKLYMNAIQPDELSTLISGYQKIGYIFTLVKSDIVPSEEIVNNMKEICDDLKVMYNLEEFPIECSFYKSFLHPGHDKVIDELDTTLTEYKTKIQKICDVLSNTTKGKNITPTYDIVNGKIVASIYVTPGKAKLLKTNKQLTFQDQRSKSKVLVISDELKILYDGIENSSQELEKSLITKYHELVLLIQQQTFHREVSKSIANIDFICANARMARKNKYYRPTLSGESSFLELRDARHPLIEKIIKYEYVPNDVSLGIKENGLLLFGVNSSGKSSLAKMVGVIIVMAQAGLYVPAKLTYHPFNKIITRLSGNDDLLRGKSSFIVEMSELRTILNNSDDRTLVLGDELCRGTESLSGTSLTLTTIEELLKRKSKFIFATHMHHLPEHHLVVGWQNEKVIRLAHLTAEYDIEIDQLVYGRKLEDGPGSSLYGLEVCKSLHINRDFIARANELRRELEGRSSLIVNNRTSNWNSKVYMDKCVLCGKCENLHTHHVKEQSTADEHGFTEHHHKNRAFNLMILCEGCHRKHHRDNRKIHLKPGLNGLYINFD